jgi:hypothetical protein
MGFTFPGGAHYVARHAQQSTFPAALNLAMGLAPVQRALGFVRNACDPSQTNETRQALLQKAQDEIQILEVGALGIQDAIKDAVGGFELEQPKVGQPPDRPKTTRNQAGLPDNPDARINTAPVDFAALGVTAGQEDFDKHIQSTFEESRRDLEHLERIGTDEGPSGTFRGRPAPDSGVAQGVKGEPTEQAIMPPANVAPRGVTAMGEPREVERPKEGEGDQPPDDVPQPSEGQGSIRKDAEGRDKVVSPEPPRPNRPRAK